MVTNENHQIASITQLKTFRGASRYYDPDYRDGFALECAAVKMVREDFGLTNLDVMIPFCRTIPEAKKVIKEMKKNHLERNPDQGKNSMRIMCTCLMSERG